MNARASLFHARIGAYLEASAKGGLQLRYISFEVAGKARGIAYLEAQLDAVGKINRDKGSVWLEGSAGFGLNGEIDISASAYTDFGKWKRKIGERSLVNKNLSGEEKSTGMKRLTPEFKFDVPDFLK